MSVLKEAIERTVDTIIPELNRRGKELERLTAERDMMVEALENLRDTKGRYHTEQAFIKAMEALAKVKK